MNMSTEVSTLLNNFPDVCTSRPKFNSRIETSPIAERKHSAMEQTCLAQSNPSPI